MAADCNDEFFGNSSLGATTKRSIAELNQPQTEKPLHYTYVLSLEVAIKFLSSDSVGVNCK